MIINKMTLILRSIFLFLSFLLGALTTVFWFGGSKETTNRFLTGGIELEVNYGKADGDGGLEYKPLKETTKLFDDKALYEPNHKQVVYLQIKNTGTIDFDYRLSMLLDDVQLGYNKDNKPIYLPDYLRCDAVFGKNEEEINEQLLQNFSEKNLSGDAHKINSFAGQRYSMAPGQTEYAALIVYMPYDVGNDANYRGDAIPSVKLGISVLAAQAGAIEYV